MISAHCLVVMCAIMATAKAQIAPSPSQIVGPAEGPTSDSTFERNDKYKLGPQPASLQKLTAHSFESGSSGSPNFRRSDKYLLPSQPADDSFAPLQNEGFAARVAAKVEAGGNMGFVKTNGTYFVLNGKITYFSGSNDYFLILRCSAHPRCLSY